MVVQDFVSGTPDELGSSASLSVDLEFMNKVCLNRAGGEARLDNGRVRPIAFATCHMGIRGSPAHNAVAPHAHTHCVLHSRRQAYVNIVAGACLAIGLRFAGTGSQDAFDCLMVCVSCPHVDMRRCSMRIMKWIVRIPLDVGCSYAHIPLSRMCTLYTLVPFAPSPFPGSYGVLKFRPSHYSARPSHSHPHPFS